MNETPALSLEQGRRRTMTFDNDDFSMMMDRGKEKLREFYLFSYLSSHLGAISCN